VLTITGDAKADRLLSDDPLALLIGMLLDQQVPMERAFTAPADLRDRLGGRLDASAIAATDPEELAGIFRTKPSLHRYPASMAGRVQELCRVIAESYGGDAAAVWSSAPSGDELVETLKSLPGFGDQKARIFTALLGKQLGVRPPGWEKASAPYGERGSFRSVADIDSPAALAKVREHKRQMKAEARAQPKASSRG
jgi:uncharacterized HhH-GPD family protein